MINNIQLEKQAQYLEENKNTLWENGDIFPILKDAIQITYSERNMFLNRIVKMIQKYKEYDFIIVTNRSVNCSKELMNHKIKNDSGVYTTGYILTDYLPKRIFKFEIAIV